jgi:HK97 family phage major capsid protein
MENIATQIKGLKEERAGKITGMDGLVTKMIGEKRSLTQDEQTQYDNFKKEVEGIDSRIAILEDAEKRALATAKTTGYAGAGSDDGDTGETERREKQKMYNKWTWKRALQIGTVRGARRDGVEAELDQIERQEMLECGVSEMSNESILAPAQVFARARNVQRRDMDATTATAAPNNEGSFTIQTNVEGIVDVFMPEMAIGKLPIMRMNNLRGNVQFPQAQTLPSAGWNTENGGATEKTPKFAKLNLSPKRLAAYIQLSNQLLTQSEANISRFANRFLVNASAIELEKAFFKGGSSNEPSGILSSTSNYTLIYAGDAVNNAVNANGSRLVWADWVKLVTTPKGVNSSDGQAYVTSPAMKGRAQITPRQSSGVEGNFILPNYNSGVNGYQVIGTTNMPDTYTKGGSTVLSAIIFGDWSQSVIASWGGMEIGIDPYVNMKEGLTNVVLNTYMDCGVLNPAAFAAIKDAQSY